MTFDINSWCELFAGKAQKTFGEKLLFIGLQGSYKRGEADDNSDIDIVVILKDLKITDLDKYKSIINSMPNKEKACGFIGGENEVTLNVDITRGYLAALRSSAGELDLLDDLRLSDLVQFPDIFTVRKRELDPEEVWEAVRGVAEEAVNSFVRMREREGRQLKEDLVGRLENIAGTLSFIEERAPVLKEEYYNRLYQKITELLADKNIDETRLVTEAAIFADRVAIDEETVRLRSHLKQFAELLETDQPVGRKLDFLVQEMNRETNTIGSKCQDVDITRRVVDIKSEIEKIREQIQNLE